MVVMYPVSKQHCCWNARHKSHTLTLICVTNSITLYSTIIKLFISVVQPSSLWFNQPLQHINSLTMLINPKDADNNPGCSIRYVHGMDTLKTCWNMHNIAFTSILSCMILKVTYNFENQGYTHIRLRENENSRSFWWFSITLCWL